MSVSAGTSLSTMDDKQAVREHVWKLMDRERVARFPGTWGHIPNFEGANDAAELLAQTVEWTEGHVVKANPDAPQLPVRAKALAEGKVLYMAVPRLRERKPFILLDPARSRLSPRKAASIRGATHLGRPVAISAMRPVDLVVCGSVAVNRRGARVGKGGGFSDLEFALLMEAGLVGEATVVVTTVHPRQILDQVLPETRHDFRVDLIVTPREVIRPRRRSRRRPQGIVWSDLDEHKITEIPVLSSLARRRPRL
jgi:5-formyltetrahydrofolate cyclo-ligase